LVNEGWSFEELMRMRASDFAFWFEEQSAYAKRQAEAAKKPRK